MFQYGKKCQGCEKHCILRSSGYWHYPQIDNETFRNIHRLNTKFDAVDYAENLSGICEFYGTTDQPTAIEKHFKIKERCDGCEMQCRIVAEQIDSHYKTRIGTDIISEFTHKNKYDAIIKGFELCKSCLHRFNNKNR